MHNEVLKTPYFDLKILLLINILINIYENNHCKNIYHSKFICSDLSILYLTLSHEKINLHILETNSFHYTFLVSNDNYYEFNKPYSYPLWYIYFYAFLKKIDF